jgi:5-methylthioadenosine/S-adenosylhomocysteine deaminase
VAWLDRLGVLGPSTLVIHAVQLDDADLDILRVRNVAVAHCPLSNARHGHGAARPAAIRAAGIRLGVGTDSVVSVGRLDPLAELRAARRLIGCTAEEALELGTIEGARLVGLEHEAGRLRPGYFADLIAVDVPGNLSGGSVAEAVLGAAPDSIRATFGSGRQVYRRGHAA